MGIKPSKINKKAKENNFLGLDYKKLDAFDKDGNKIFTVKKGVAYTNSKDISNQ